MRMRNFGQALKRWWERAKKRLVCEENGKWATSNAPSTNHYQPRVLTSWSPAKLKTPAAKQVIELCQPNYPCVWSFLSIHGNVVTQTSTIQFAAELRFLNVHAFENLLSFDKISQFRRSLHKSRTKNIPPAKQVRKNPFFFLWGAIMYARDRWAELMISVFPYHVLVHIP